MIFICFNLLGLDSPQLAAKAKCKIHHDPPIRLRRGDSLNFILQIIYRGVSQPLVIKTAEVLSEDNLNLIAVNIGFKRRLSKITPKIFFENLVHNASSNLPLSLNSLSVEIGQAFGVNVARQSLSERFSEKSVSFLKEILSQLSFSRNTAVENGWLELFNSVRIKDSTKFVLPEEYASIMPGFGGVSSKSAACIQFEYDLKTGTILDLNITPGNRPDAKDAVETKDNVTANDLFIRDLGYFSTDVIANFIENKAYVISKLNTKSLVYEMIEDEYVLLDFEKLYNWMDKRDIKQVEKQVYIGITTKLPVRIIIETVPEEVYIQRIRKANKSNSQRGYKMTDQHKIRSKFNLIITNIAIETIPKMAISALYHMRWQIELVFKIWKSTFGIHKIGKMKYHRWLSQLYAKLILIAIYWQSIMASRSDIYQRKGKLLSMDKCFKTLRIYTYKLIQAITEGKEALLRLEVWMNSIISENHWLERKKNKLSFEQIMYIEYCKSGIYVYI